MSRRVLGRGLTAVLGFFLLADTGLGQTVDGTIEKNLAKVLGAPPPQSYAVSRVQIISGGLPVAGFEDGVVYSPTLDGDCLPTERPPVAAFASTIGSPLRLEISTSACRKAATPKIDCSWALIASRPEMAAGALMGFTGAGSCGTNRVPPRAGHASWSEGRGLVELPPSPETGIYILTLICDIDGRPSAPPLLFPLFVTYDEPLTVYSPPEISWYARSACWAAGTNRRSSEADVLQAILDGISRFGQASWRYGYAQTGDAENTYDFHLYESSQGSSQIRYTIHDEKFQPRCTSQCKCYWQGLVGIDSPCNFADCYVFSDVLQAAAGVMGVGGLKIFSIRGEAQIGFLTNPTQALDPKFTGNVACPESLSTCYPYAFSSHSLRQRDGVYFDTTFGETYEDPSQPIALSQRNSANNVVTFLDSDRVLFSMGRRYGSWGFYVDPPRVLNHQLSTDTDGEIHFKKAVSFSQLDSNGDGVNEQLVASFEVELLRPGTFLIHGGLNKGDKVIARQPKARTSQPSVAIVTGKPGTYSAELYFSGEEIFGAGVDGPYSFFALISGSDYKLDRLEAETDAYSHRDFGEDSASISDAETEGVDRNGNGLFDVLNLKIPLTVRSAGLHPIEARLSKGERTIAYSGSKESFEVGEHTVELDLPGAKIAKRRIDGPYELTLTLYDDRLRARQDDVQTVEGLKARLFDSND